MIVKNGSKTLRNCLQSVREVVDEIVVVDTGSTDETLQIAREFDARCVPIPWESDFSVARNVGLDLATTDWILSLDADEELDREAPEEIRKLVCRQDFGGFVVTIRNYLSKRHGSINGNRAIANDGRCKAAEGAPAYAINGAVKLFRLQPNVRYRGCVHETIGPQIMAAGSRLADANFCIHHLGFLAGEQQSREKADFYLALLRKKVTQEPDNALAWVELARQLQVPFEENQEALRCVAQALAISPDMAEAWFTAGSSWLSLGQNEQALAALEHCKNHKVYGAESEHYRGDALHDLGKLTEARAAYERCLALVGHDPQVESKLGYVEVRLGDYTNGFRRMERGLQLLPLGAELHERLIKSYVAAGRMTEAAAAAERFASVLVHPRTVLRAAAIRVHLKQSGQAQMLIEKGLRYFPDSPELQQAKIELASAAK